MKSEPVLIIMSVVCAVLGALTQIPLPPPWGIVATLGTVACGAVLARSKVTPTP